jgi:hypothetical protein
VTSSASGPPPGLFVFRFRLSPAHACNNLNFQNLSVLDAALVCTRDVLGVRRNAVPGDVRPLILEAKARAALLLDVHAYCAYPTRPQLDLVSESWIEVRDAGDKETVFGYSDPSLESTGLVSGHPDNEPFMEAAKLLTVAVSRVPDLAHAFNDFRSARTQVGSYVKFFANRVLEDVGYLFGRRDDHPDWDSMNAALKTTTADWALISRGAARHNPLTPIPDADRTAVLDLAHSAIQKYIDWEHGQAFVSLTRSATTFIASATPGRG